MICSRPQSRAWARFRQVPALTEDSFYATSIFPHSHCWSTSWVGVSRSRPTQGNGTHSCCEICSGSLWCRLKGRTPHGSGCYKETQQERSHLRKRGVSFSAKGPSWVHIIRPSTGSSMSSDPQALPLCLVNGRPMVCLLGRIGVTS